MPPQCKVIGCGFNAAPGKDYCHTHGRELQTTLPLQPKEDPPVTFKPEAELTGGSVNYYTVPVADPISGGSPYAAQCGDIIEALQMDFNEGNAFKAIWRKCAARALGLNKKGNTPLYDAEKVAYFGERMIAVEQRKQAEEPNPSDD